ncbi:Uncharacterized protein SAMN03097699_0213 [Flavobacteriaceae bacterium MAR_2010_188]|nr:Uncharacterized protein SAMN03097699_0213 [Flavobacteriaceae bacterium MAR_2010_188]
MKKLLSALFILTSLFAFPQELSMDVVKNMKPRNIGPAGMSGRVTAIDVVNDNPEIMYAGTASGGLWKSTSGGIKWEPVFEHEVTASIGSVAIQQSNPSVVWVGTGEGNPRNSLNGGYGIFKSLDGGKTWKSMGLEKTRHIHRVLINPNNPDIVYAAAIGSPWGAHPEKGVFKTTDGGETWEKVLYVNDQTGAAELVMDPTNPNKLIAAMWEHKREPWFFNSGGEGSGLYTTYDGGKNWKKTTEEDGFPKGNLGRIGIAIAPSKPNRVYALVEAKKNGLYRSDDGGSTWNLVNSDLNEIGNRPFYYGEIHVAPDNENRIYTIFTYVNVSEDAGKSFSALMPSYGVDNGVHPDHHAWWIHPKNGDFMMDGNDGGLNITRDGGKTWRFIDNIPVAQFYHINVDNEFPYNVYGGLQDNGSWRGPAYLWRAQGIRNSYWQEISFGDGFDVVPDPDNSQYGWTMSQQGSVSRYDWVTGNNYTVKPTHPDPNIELRFNWNSAINIDPFDNSTVYFGSQYVHKSTDKGDTWKVISPDLTTNDPEKQKQSESGGLTLDATGAENHTTILVIEPSPVEKNMMWVGTDDGRVHYTTDWGENWTDVSKNIKGLPAGSWIPQIKASTKNKGEALLIANDYRRFNYTPYAYRTKDYGKTWERIVDENDVQSYTLSIAQDPEEPNLIFLGTDDGLYVSLNAGSSWKKWTEGFPTVSVKDLVIHPRENDLVIGTFGRAVWILDDIRPLRDMIRNKDMLKGKLDVFTPPTAYQAASQQPTGSRFGADAVFNGENRSGAARIRYYVAIEEKKKEEADKDSKAAKDDKKDKRKKVKDLSDNKEEDKNDEAADTMEREDFASADSTEVKEKVTKWDSLTMNIYDGDRLIRTLKQKAPEKSGIYTWEWYMDEKGTDYPLRGDRRRGRGNREPGGVSVKPGQYKVEMIFGDKKDETTIEVKADPRLEVSQTNTDETYKLSKEIEELRQTTADAIKQLVESKGIADDYAKRMEDLNKKKYKLNIKTAKDMSKEIDSIIDIYLGKEDERQGIVRNPEVTVMERINTARYYVASRQNGITSTETTLLKNAKDALQDALSKTNTFFNNRWPEFKETMKSLDLDPFKETETFKLD